MAVLSKVGMPLFIFTKTYKTPIIRSVISARTLVKNHTTSDKTFYKTSNASYPVMKPLPLPSNLEDLAASENARFSPQRSRDINGSLISGDICRPSTDSRVICYDSTGCVSLSSAMQTTVPQPCPEEDLYTHFNMPGGLWRQGEKYVAADHLTTSTFVRHFSSNSHSDEKTPSNVNDYKTLTRKEKLKTAVKEYGSVVVVFHVAISLVSLGACYLAVTSGIDFTSILSQWQSTEGAEAATTAAPFVMAYAIHKVFAPVRISITLISVPLIVKYLRRIGFVKPPKRNT